MPYPRKSAQLHALSGAYTHNPKRRRRDLKASGVIGPWQERSSDPRQVWDELVAGAPQGVLTTADRQALEYAVRLIVDMRTDPMGFPASKGTLLVNLLGKLGCLPASRLQMATSAPKDENDPAEKYFDR
jgi:hypothetical protein